MITGLELELEIAILMAVKLVAVRLMVVKLELVVVTMKLVVLMYQWFAALHY